MLNLIASYTCPENISKISGIPENWNRSNYNRENYAASSLAGLVDAVRAKFVLISFNSEGFIGMAEMKGMLEKQGKVEVMERKYNTFRGGRNLRARGIHVKEFLYLLEK